MSNKPLKKSPLVVSTDDNDFSSVLVGPDKPNIIYKGRIIDINDDKVKIQLKNGFKYTVPENFVFSSREEYLALKKEYGTVDINDLSVNSSHYLPDYAVHKPQKSLQRPTSSLEKFLRSKTPIFSLDFETTGAFPQNATVTQVGYTGRKSDGTTISKEYAIKDSVDLSGKTAFDVTKEELDWLEKENARRLNKGMTLLDRSDLLRIPNEQDLLRAHELSGARAFGLEQLEAGSLQSVVDEYRRSVIKKADSPVYFKFKPTTRTESGGVTAFQSALTAFSNVAEENPGITLIQNANFESRVTEAATEVSSKVGTQRLGTDKDPRAFVRHINEVVYNHTGLNKTFALDSKIIGARKAFSVAMSTYKQVLGTSAAPYKELDNIQKASKNLLDAIFTVTDKNLKAGYSTTVDLMDITKIYQTALAFSIDKMTGIRALDPALIGVGTNVNLVSRALGFGEESHTALSDSKQQLQIFDELTKRIEKLGKGKYDAAEHMSFIQHMNDPIEHERQFMKGLKNRVEEEHLRVTEKIKAGELQEGSYHIEMGKRIRRSGGNSLRFYKGVPERDGFSRRAEVDSLVNYFMSNGQDDSLIKSSQPVTPQGSPSIPLAKPTSNPTKGPMPPQPTSPGSIQPTTVVPSPGPVHTPQSTAHNVLTALNTKYKQAGIYNSPKPTITTAALQVQKSAQPLKGGINPIKVGMYAIGAMTALNLLSKDSSPPQSPHVDSYEALYGNLYMGTAYADWKERNNSHKMIY